MTETYGDALTRPFWAAAAEHRLLLQHCSDCGRWQFYPRPFCLSCWSDDLAWREAAGTGLVYSATEVHVQIVPELTPPYTVAVVELDEGPRLTANLVGEPAAIGERVRLRWRDRPDGPPLPVFERIDQS